MKKFLLFILILQTAFNLNLKADSEVDAKGNGNPLLPGYFADPTVKVFDGTYYIYATADGVKLASGEPTVWVSNDFENWFNYEMEIELPEGLTNCWAPDVQVGADGRYYYFMGNCQFGCNIYGYVSDNPIGPWSPINDGNPVIPVGTGKDGLPALDAQFFIDNDGKVYAYFGTWCTSFGGLGWAEFNPDDFSIIDQGYIPVSQLPQVFEAAYAFKRNGKYILMYSSGDCRLSSYKVHYAWADSPTGPFHYGENNPILETNTDGTIDSPGHHSVLEVGGEYFIIYHRHDNPHSSGGMFRQTCADSLIFVSDTEIAKVNATHKGVGAFVETFAYHENLVLNGKASATSSYTLVAEENRFSRAPINHEYKPEYAIDDNNGTLWKAASAALPQSLVVDLGSLKPVRCIHTQFEYTTYYYQYLLEVSTDSVSWEVYSDMTANQTAGCPMIDENDMEARYIRLTVTGTEKTGLFAAVWNMEVYEVSIGSPGYKNQPVTDSEGVQSSNSKLFDFSVEDLDLNTVVDNLQNKGTVGGLFKKSGLPVIDWIDSVKAVYLNGTSYIFSSEMVPPSLGWNAAYTASAWVYNPDIGNGECIMGWTSRDDMLMSSYTAMMYGNSNFGAVAHGDGYVDIRYEKLPKKGEWHHITVTFDGMLENIYVDGELDTQLPLMLFVEPDRFRLGASGNNIELFSGYIANAQLFDMALTAREVVELMEQTRPPKVEGPSSSGFLYDEGKYRIDYDSTNQSLTINSFFDEGYLKQVSIYNLNGEELETASFNKARELTLTGIHQGAYIIVLESAANKYTDKIMLM
ncbi:MAG: family 43 glycosylhydrolase [Prolixibacteraceae bacterium]|nr:family 43 glycosylhydrolase [Prolixibacteraceae bacterium]